MGYSTWHTYGYGICTDDIETTVEKIEELLSKAPKYRKEIHDWFKECEIAEPTMEDYMEFDQDYCGGLATMLQSVIWEVEGIQFDYADDFDGCNFLLYIPCYVWQLNEKEKNFTEKDVTKLFVKYVSILTDKPIEIDYRSVENGG
jgi:hypothetical protein